MDIRSQVADSGGEQGLLGLAFHPDFETNRRVFVYYTRNGGDIVLARFTANGDIALGDRHRLVPDGDRAQRTNQPQRRRDGLRAGRLPVHRHG